MTKDKYGFHNGDDYLTITKNDEPLASVLYPSAAKIKEVRKVIITLNSQGELLAAAKALISHDKARDKREVLSNCFELERLQAAIFVAEGR